MSNRVLVVDDEPAICEAIGEALRKAGFSVHSACDGKQCLEAVAEEQPDVIVLDLVMPVMDGYTALHQLRLNRETSRLPVVVLTGKPGEPGELAGWMSGFDRYVEKPCNIAHLVATVRELLPSPPEG